MWAAPTLDRRGERHSTREPDMGAFEERGHSSIGLKVLSQKLAARSCPSTIGLTDRLGKK
jgi:hypothetical protein